MQKNQQLINKLEKDLIVLRRRREKLLRKVDEARSQFNEEYESPIFEDSILELQSVVSQICDYENTIKTMKGGKENVKIEKEEPIQVGDCVTLKNHTHIKQFCIAKHSDYVNPDLGIISGNSPIGKQLLSSKFGQNIELSINGTSTEYQILS